MPFLNRLIEDAQMQRLIFATENDGLNRYMYSHLLEHAPNAMCFLGPPFDEIASDTHALRAGSYIPNLQCPYPVTWYEFDAPLIRLGKQQMPSVLGVLATGPPENAMFHICALCHSRVLILSGAAYESGDILGEDLVIGYTIADKRKQVEMDILSDTMLCVFNMNALLNCKNISHLPIVQPNSKQQKKRVKHNKLPLFTYHTLSVFNALTKSSNTKGGDGTPKRIHLRRGHIRHCHSGVTAWVSACVVGTQRGIVHKEYKVESGVANA